MRLNIVRRVDQIDPSQWDDLAPTGNPFLSHAFLSGLETSGCVCSDSGWEAHHLVLYDGPQDATTPVAAVPLYLKYHSWGEYVFDWAWADAYQRAGLDYYPKLLCAVPFTPVTGPRLLVHPRHPDPDRARQTLATALLEVAEDSGVSSLHVLFTTPGDTRALEQQGLMRRSGNQFQWRNDGYHSFEHYLGSFTAAKRKKIRRERRRVRESGIEMEAVSGAELTADHWEAMYRFYRLTAYNHGAYAYLNSAFFDHLRRHLAQHVVMVLARQDGRYVGGALNIVGDDALFGRYWGADAFYDGLHFETCYYQPIEYCIRNRLARFEAGAQGEHKLSRGLLPATTTSVHWLKDPRFRDAIADFLHVESEHVGRYKDALHEHTPFK